MKKIRLHVAADGTITTLHTDAIDLTAFGPLHVERASNVEFDNTRQGWTVQLADGAYLAWPSRDRGEWFVTGTALNAHAFANRQAALDAEVAYLNSRLAEVRA